LNESWVVDFEVNEKELLLKKKNLN